MAFPTTSTAAIQGTKEPCTQVPNRHRGIAYMSITAMKQALEALENNRQTHHYCEDTWYSCPKHEDGCANDAEGNECNCGADKANVEIDAAITSLRQAIAKADRATELLERCENEMRYAGWTKYEADNFARNGVYEQVKQYLEKST